MGKVMRAVNIFIGKLFACGVRGYQFTLSPDHGFMRRPWGYCRFFPTCSEYTRQSLIRHGAFRGIVLAIRRIIKCHPLHPPSYDPVP
ncbi:MAG: membrane protein insertion efficiency factor YidD [Patescibacteria group bacterium]